MSRNGLPASASRYKISNPQPAMDTSADGRYSNDPSSSYRQPPLSSASSNYPSEPYRQAPSSLRTNGTAAAPASGGPGGSPARPARSKMREAPQPPGMGSPPSRASAPRSNLTSIQTQNIRRPSADSFSQAYEGISPVSPVNPADGPSSQGQPNQLFSDPFAADRSQRTELRAQASAVVQQASRPMQSGPSGDKLRSAVGAFMSASKSRDREDSTARRPQKSEARQRARREAVREEVWDMSGGEHGTFAEIDGVLRKIRKDWPFVLESDFSSSTLALSLLNQGSSSLPQHPSLNSFLRLHDALSAALQAAVQAHFQSFAASLPAHASFLSTLGRAQQQIKASKEALKEAREGFAGKGKSELAGVRARERQVREMLKILDTIDNLKQVPDQLESLIGEKKFLQAALILVRSLKTANRPEIAEIGAMSDLRAYFVSQESILSDILVEELHNHVYLKTFYSDSRWKAYVPGQRALPSSDVIDKETRRPGSFRHSNTPHMNGENGIGSADTTSRFSQFITGLANKPQADPALELDADLSAPNGLVTRRGHAPESMPQASSHMSLSSLVGTSEHVNPESDSFAYMETLLEALAALGRLGAALETVAQRVAGEVHALIDTTLDEVDDRSEQRREELEAAARPQSMLVDGTSSPGPSTIRPASVYAPAESQRIAMALDAVGPARHSIILQDLFWTLYSKLAAVLEGHRVLYEVARWISSRRDFKDASTKATTTLNIPVLEVWKPVQQEVSSLLRDYLTDVARSSSLDRQAVMSVNEVLRDGKLARDKQRAMFKFSDTDARATTNDLKVINDSVQQALKGSVPGLVNLQTNPEAQVNSRQDSVLQGTMANADDRYSTSGRHRSLIPPNAFNVSILFQPTLAFIHRATEIIPPGFEEETGAFGTVLEDFVVKVFLPQLDEKVTASFQQAVSGYDAFEIDRFVDDGLDKPPLKSSVRVMGLIRGLCVMLQTTPFHRENYSRLIIGVIVQYYQQCSARFKDLASLPQQGPGEPPLALPGQWAQREDVIAVLSDLRNVVPLDRLEMASVALKEVKIEMDLLGDQSVVESQLINSVRKLEALSRLMQSLRWFIDSLLDLQSEAEEPISLGDGDPSRDVTLLVPASTADQLGPNAEPRLPLTRAMAQRYEAIVQTYEQLAEMVLNTIRLEVRCRVICNLGASMRTGDYRLESESLEPDPDVIDLNSSLTENDEIVTGSLNSTDREFVFRSLGTLVDHLFIHSARSIKMVNPAGVKKIKRNILALQQSLRSINHGPDEGVLSRCVAYWDLYEAGPREMLEALRTSKPLFTFEDYNTMLNLQCKTDMAEAPSSELNTYLIDLHALSMSIEGWEIGIE